MNILTKDNIAIDENGTVSINEEIYFTLDMYLEILDDVSENNYIYKNLSISQTEAIDAQNWEDLQTACTIEELWEERDWFESWIVSK